MKRAELIIGKAYYMNKSTNWRENHYGGTSYAGTAKSISYRKVIIIETQLKTEAEKLWRTRDVLIQDDKGKQGWVPLNHIRTTWAEAVKILTDDRRRIKVRQETSTGSLSKEPERRLPQVA